MRSEGHESKDSRGSFVVQCIQDLCRAYGLLIRSDVQSFQAVFANSFVSPASSGGEELSFAHPKFFCAAEKTESEKFLAASEENLVDAERRIHEYEDKDSILSDLATMVYNTEAVNFQETCLFSQS